MRAQQVVWCGGCLEFAVLCPDRGILNRVGGVAGLGRWRGESLGSTRSTGLVHTGL